MKEQRRVVNDQIDNDSIDISAKEEKSAEQ